MTNRVPSAVAESGDVPTLNGPLQTAEEAARILRRSAYNAEHLEAAANENDTAYTTEP
jgi:hypothetical protein